MSNGDDFVVWMSGLWTLLRRRDFLTYALLVTIAGAGWMFIELADELEDGELHNVDLELIHLLRDPVDPTNPLGPRWLEEWMRDITALGSVPVLALLTLVVVVTLWMEKRRRAVAWLVAAILGAVAINPLFKWLFARDRPDILDPELLPSSFSFPSGHAFMSAAIYLTIGALLTMVIERRATRMAVIAMAVLITLLVGFSRVYLAVHFPSDVLAGWTLGCAWASLCWIVAWNMRKP
jgi:undecaprenyl-diphosphatase